MAFRAEGAVLFVFITGYPKEEHMASAFLAPFICLEKKPADFNQLGRDRSSLVLSRILPGLFGSAA